MSLLEIIFLAIALAMDCFAVSIVCGVLLKQSDWGTQLRIALLFGLFQAMMPLLGWLLTSSFSTYITDFDHWIAFGLLAFLGGKMIWESLHPEEESAFNPHHLKTQITLAIATSIDALAVGISFACLGYNSFVQLFSPLAWIGAASFVLSILGSVLGISLGKKTERLLKPELIGGLILLAIGVKILWEHLRIS